MSKELIMEVGEWSNNIVIDSKGVWLRFDEELLEEVIEMLERLRDEEG